MNIKKQPNKKPQQKTTSKKQPNKKNEHQNLSANSHFNNVTLLPNFYSVGILGFCDFRVLCSASLCGVEIVKYPHTNFRIPTVRHM